MSAFVYHERQAAALCGRHAVNNLLQGPHYDDISLANIALSLDQREAALLGGAAAHRLMGGGSNNVDDSGNFSVDTLREALKQCGVDFSCEKALVERALNEPDGYNAFMLNHEAHWIALRRFGSQWVNLNSLLEAPELVSNFFLSAFLSQLRADKYSVFVISGVFPPPTPPQFHERERWHNISELQSGNNTRSKQAAAERKSAAARAQKEAASDPDFEAALRASLSDGGGGGDFSRPQALASDDDDLRRAIAASLDYSRGSRGGAAVSDKGPIETVTLIDDDDEIMLTRAQELSLVPSIEACLARFRTLSLLLGAEPLADNSGGLRCARLSLRCTTPVAPWPGSYPTAVIPFSSERRFICDAPVSTVFAWAELEWLRAFLPPAAVAGIDTAAVLISNDAGRAAPFSLTVSFPRKILSANDERSIEEAGLFPSGVLTITKI